MIEDEGQNLGFDLILGFFYEPAFNSTWFGFKDNIIFWVRSTLTQAVF